MIPRLGPYRVVKKLADGGMGSVFLGMSDDGRRVVLKVPLEKSPEAAVALGDEARMGFRLRHEGIVQTLEFLLHEGWPVLVVEYIEGCSLEDLRDSGPLPPRSVVRVGARLASALAAIHEACDESGRPLHMLHRDVSPSNVLVDTQGHARLIDLGIARSDERRQRPTDNRFVKGKLRYLAPEVLQGGMHSQQSDVWALGVTLWEAALGRPAVDGDELETMQAAIQGTLPTLLPGENLDLVLEGLLRTLLSTSPRHRPTARAAGQAFVRLLEAGDDLSFPDRWLSTHVRARVQQELPPATTTEPTEKMPVSALPSLSSIEAVFTSSHARPRSEDRTERTPRNETPTQPAKPEPPPTLRQMPAFVIDDEPTLREPSDD